MHYKNVIIITFFISSVFFMSYAQTWVQSPAHESKIISMEIHENTLYTLDANGLLQSTNINTDDVQYSIPVRQEINFAYFYFPYVAIIDTDYLISVYNITRDVIEYTGLFSDSGNKGYVNFSPDYSIFTFTSRNKILMLDTNVWQEISSIPYRNNNQPNFLIISQNNKNLMSYDYETGINYKEINSSKNLKHINIPSKLSSLILNTSKRFGVGFWGREFTSIDLISGNIIDSIMFASPIQNIYTSSLFNPNYIEINLVTSNNDASNNIKQIRFNSDGTLSEQNNININIDNNPSYIISNKNQIFVGLNDGEVWEYNTNNITTPPKILNSDNTLAIYDVTYQKDSIILSTVEGIVSFQAHINDAQIQISNDISLSPQQLENPSFIFNTNRENQTEEIYVMSSSSPYNHKIPKLLLNAKKVSPSNNLTTTILPFTSETLLYPFDTNNFTLGTPILMQKNITNIQLVDTQKISYSAPNSHMYIYNENNSDNKGYKELALFSSRVIYDVNKHKEQLILWTNSPLNNYNSNNNLSNNTLYSYIIDNDLTKFMDPIPLNFINKEIFYFHTLKSSPLSLIVSTVNFDKEHTKIYLINANNTIQTPEDPPKSPVETITLLSTIPSTQILKMEAFNDDNNLLIIENNRIIVLSLDNNHTQLENEYSIFIPKEFGIYLNSNISKIDDGFVITLVDKNNVVLIYQLDNNMQLHVLSKFNILTPHNTIGLLK